MDEPRQVQTWSGPHARGTRMLSSRGAPVRRATPSLGTPAWTPIWRHKPTAQLSGVSGTGVDRVPPALAIPPPAGANRRRRALGRVPVVVAIYEAVAPTSLGRPGASVVTHTRTLRQPCDR